MFTRPRIIPVLLISDRDMVKTVQFGRRTYLGDPVNAVRIFNRKGIDELAVLDISATRQGLEPDFELLEDIASQAFMPLSYGGGITSLEQAKRLLAIGYEKVVINTQLVKNVRLVEEIVSLAGSQSVVASIDAKKAGNKYQCVISDGSQLVDISPVELAKQAQKLGVGEIFLNSVDRDGMMEGYDLELVKSV
ncbi:MAG: HisA/HisF-related TIM barrel protein, partial [Clostridium sp.]|nr:HisA/HisF-related TIM barrel protein [Clostridium sp.]